MKPYTVLTPLALLSVLTALFLMAGIAYAEPRPSPTPHVQAAAATRTPATPVPAPPAKTPKARQSGDDHDRYGFSLARHQTKADGSPFACADCHPESVKKFDAATCQTCHRAMNSAFITQHIAAYGEYCTACHDGVDRFSPDIFDHNKLNFSLVGRHAETACTACHTGVRRLDDFKLAPTTCVGCHAQDNPHPDTFSDDCAACHTSESWQTEVFDHNLATFKLTGKHQTVACADCHINHVYQGTPQTCVGCHAADDVHLGAYGSDCAACHITETWQRGPFAHTFPLDHGGQGFVACATCHPNASAKTVYTCYNCHNPVDITRIHASGRRMQNDIADCVRCHPTGEPTMPMRRGRNTP